jgi:hypothetical protein
MLVLASLPLPVADIEADLDGSGYSLVAEGWDLNHQGILVRERQRRSRWLASYKVGVMDVTSLPRTNHNSHLWLPREP